MKTLRIETFLTLAMMVISIQSLAAIEKPMKKPMGYILNRVLKAESTTEKGLMYHTLFNQPQYLDYVLTGPKHTVLAESKITKLRDMYNFQSWLNQKN